MSFTFRRATKLSALMAFAAICQSHAAAQTYENTTVATINGSNSCSGPASAYLQIPFNVTGAFTVSDLNLGFTATHVWRGDIRLDLTSPAGPGQITQRILNSDTSGSGNIDHYDMELDDAAGTLVNTSPHDTPDNVAAPYYENLVRPNAFTGAGTSLTAFNGLDANGIWTLTVCDDYPSSDHGQFQRAALIFTAPTTADLSLSVNASDPTPEIGTLVALTFPLINSGPLDADNVTAQINLPSGLSYNSHSGPGSYNDVTGLWTLPATISNGSTQTLTINALVNPSGPYGVSAEVEASDQPDPDSTPGNNVTTEDDYDALTLIPTPSVSAPALTCPAASQVAHIWDAPAGTNGWTAGALTGSYTASGIDLDFTLTGDTGNFIPRSGTATPYTSTEFTGGPAPGGANEHGVVFYTDHPDVSSSVDIAIDIGTPGKGVKELQFSIYDIDAGGWIDRATITGTLNGTGVTPILTESAANSASGNTVVGTGGSSAAQGLGNVTVTFLDAVDKVNINYGNDPSAPANPSAQIASLQRFTMCPASEAKLTAVKTVEVYDPASLGLYALPGNDVVYRITVTNDATATAVAENVKINDILPDNVEFVSVSSSGFIGGTFTSPAPPVPTTDCAGGACEINFEGASLNVNSTGEIQIQAHIK